MDVSYTKKSKAQGYNSFAWGVVPGLDVNARSDNNKYKLQEII